MLHAAKCWFYTDIKKKGSFVINLTLSLAQRIQHTLI